MQFKVVRLILVGVLAFLPLVVQASDALRERLQQQLQRLDPTLEINRLTATPVTGIHEAWLSSGDLLYLSEDGQHLFAGNLLKIGPTGLADLTEAARSLVRSEAVQAVPASEQVVFPAQGETRAVIQVFTDITCPYCVRLHEQVAELNQQGIEVRYLAFPRQGLNGPAHQQLVNVWCADDRRLAMNRAKAGRSNPERQCDNPVAAQYDLGRRQGIQGTPAILLPSGRLIPGFLPADRLLQELAL